MGVSKSVEGGGTVQGVPTHPVVDQRVNAPAELLQLGVDAVEDRVLQIEDAVREHGTVTLGIGRLLRWRLALAQRPEEAMSIRRGSQVQPTPRGDLCQAFLQRLSCGF